jgi:hypothetical protein
MKLVEHTVVLGLRSGYLYYLTESGRRRLERGGQYHGRFKAANGIFDLDAVPHAAVRTVAAGKSSTKCVCMRVCVFACLPSNACL